MRTEGSQIGNCQKQYRIFQVCEGEENGFFIPFQNRVLNGASRKYRLQTSKILKNKYLICLAMVLFPESLLPTKKHMEICN